MAGSLLWNLHAHHLHTVEKARQVGRIILDNDLLYRKWIASQGGLYARVTHALPPNPHLTVPDRDVTTTAGTALTLVNPAYFARLVFESSGSPLGARAHLTSLRPMRPANRADAWETAALLAFEKGAKETHAVMCGDNGQTLRLMCPFVTEGQCLRCHTGAEDREGAIRGGVSVSVPLASLDAPSTSPLFNLRLAHLGLWLVGLFGITVSRRSLAGEISARGESDLRLRRLNAELERRVADQTAEIREANEALERRIAARTAEIAAANEQLLSSRAAALNLMEDAVAAREQTEQANAAARQERANLQTIFDAVSVGMLLIDEHGAVRRVNREVSTWLGTSDDILRCGVQPGDGLGCVHALAEGAGCGHTPHCSRCPIRTTFTTALATQRPVRSVEAAVSLIADGVTRQLWLDVSADPVIIDGRTYAVLSMKDISSRKQAELRLMTSLHEKEVLLKEVHHRVKNNLQVVSSLVSLQAETLTDPALRHALGDVRDRVRTMALVHEQLYQSENLSAIEFAKYARTLLGYLLRAQGRPACFVRLNLKLQPVVLSVETAAPCGLILNELASNALKHAFRNRAQGELAVTLRTDAAGQVHLSVRDDGVGMPPDAARFQSKSLGLRLVRLLAAQLRATLALSNPPEGGTEFQLTFCPNPTAANAVNAPAADAAPSAMRFT